MVRQTEQPSASLKEGEERGWSRRRVLSHNRKWTRCKMKTCDRCNFSIRHVFGTTNFISNKAPAAEMVYWHVEELWSFLSSTPIVILPFSGQNVKLWGPSGELELSPSLRSLVFTAVPLLTLFSNYAAFPVVSLHSQWVTDSSLFKVKNNPLYIFISSPHYFFIPLGLL